MGTNAMLDEVDRQILNFLARNARISLKELAAAVDLSSPSASERLKRLEERGVIRAFTIEVDPQALGYTLQAILRIRPRPDQFQRVQQMVEEIAQFCECDKVTGDDCLIARLHVRSIEELDEIVDRIGDKADTNTAIVKSQPLKRRLPPL
jgi:Lrp/AsnC family transcriptional regulator, leucine-responsive regulatory protein